MKISESSIDRNGSPTVILSEGGWLRQDGCQNIFSRVDAVFLDMLVCIARTSYENSFR
jgi:hypothetical protein